MPLTQLGNGAWGSALLLSCVVASLGCSSTGEPGWTRPDQANSTRFAAAPLLFAGGEGRTLALWRLPEVDGAGVGIAASWHVPGRGWMAHTIVDDYRSQSIAPSAATDSNGNAIVVWTQDAPGTQNGEVWARRYLIDDGWADPELVGVVPLGLRSTPGVAFDNDGGAVATWLRPVDDSDLEELVVSRYAAGVGWGVAEGFETTSAFGETVLLATSVDPAGRVLVIWRGSEAPWGNRFTDDEGWGTPQSFQQSSLLGVPQVEVDEQGRAWAYWPASEDTGSRPGATRYDDDGWEAASVFSTDCDGGSGGAFSLDGTGGAVAVWSCGASDETQAFWTRFIPGAGWSEAERMPLGSGSGPPTFGVTALPGGQAYAIAYRLGAGFQPEGGGADGRLLIWGTTLTAGVDQWGAPERLSVDGPYLSVSAPYGSPQIVSYEDDMRALALWLQYDGDSDDIPNGLDNTPWSSEHR